MTPAVTRAITTHERACIRLATAHTDYVHLRGLWAFYRTDRLRIEAIAARTRWTTLYDLLIAEPVELAVAS